MTIDPETLYSLSEVPDKLPRRRGKKVNLSTVYRWIRIGVRGKRLQAQRFGGIYYVRGDSLLQFLGEAPRCAKNAPPSRLVRDELRSVGFD